MIQKYIETILKDILNIAYPQKGLENFILSIVPSERKSFHGKYLFKTKTIVIYNFSRGTHSIIATAIHELAHHVNYILYNGKGHEAKFYDCYKKLMETAIKIGLVNYEILKQQKDVNDINMLEKKAGKPTAKYTHSLNKRKDINIIVVKADYKNKIFLKEQHFYYDKISCYWYKIVPKNKVEEILKYLKTKKPELKINNYEYYKLPLTAVYYIIVDSPYNKKDLLKKRGYKYYNDKKLTNKWVKQIMAEDYYNEITYLIKERFDYKTKNNINF